VRELSPAQVRDILKASGLAGRGGAGFPTWRKWAAVAEAEGEPKTIVCNADEGEPGCFKDRVLMDYDPHAVIEGMAVAAYATGATRGFLYLRYEYPETEGTLEAAIADAEAAGLVGDGILGTEFGFRLMVRRGAGAYICGEETSLLNSLEGKHPFPRNRPPFPVTHGYENLPTVVNNVETLASVPHILARGPEWYADLGLGDQAGTKVISLSGDIRRPGNYEVPLGLPLRTLLMEWAGGPLEGRRIQAVTMAGLSGGFIAGVDLDEVTLDEPSIRARGGFLGAGGVMVFDDSRDMVDVARSAMEFFAHESCGKCFPCRIGTQRLVERLSGDGPDELEAWIDEVTDLNETMKKTSACGLGMAAPLIAESLLRYFPDQVSSHVTGNGR
jgi:NADH:ubiquinone oxidoreductase subunit F (NADH-binding)